MKLRAEKITIAIKNKIICDKLNLNINPGEVWGILGANGSGKTTLLHTLAGLKTVNHGTIFLNDDALEKLSRKKIAQTLAILFQDFYAPFPQTVNHYCSEARYPHLAYFARNNFQDKKIVNDALQQMELTHLKHQNVTTLSGGEKRRLAIAALLAQTPQIYLLDEPTNHLDIRHQFLVLNYFRNLAKQNAKSILMSLHDVNHAQHFCDYVLLLYPDGSAEQGKTNSILTPENLTRLYQHPVRSYTNNNMLYWALNF